jgi:hypothetical protein
MGSGINPTLARLARTDPRGILVAGRLGRALVAAQEKPRAQRPARSVYHPPG